MEILNGFASFFRTLTDNNPFPWQRALFERFIDGDFPESCNLPTGLGKTAVIPIWLLALAQAPSRVPRRLVYVVNRRTVVDQATREAEFVRERLKAQPELCVQLRNLCAVDCDLPLAISTLRGQFADNSEWRLDPSRPAIVVGTVDMIGSRLLFSGYRCGFKSRPLHAGFLGQDSLLVHDEAHLEPAFQELLLAIKKEQERSGDFRKLKVMELSATPRGTGKPFELSVEDRKVAEVRKRLNAKKKIELHSLDDEKKLADRIGDLALIHRGSGQAILVFLRRVEDVEKVVARLRKEKLPVETLTGTMRGKERDALVEKSVFRRFLPKATSDGSTVYLVCTSAGEVGINISANHLVCDLSPFDSMAQRFGRVNRFGDGDATISIVHPSKFPETPLDERRKLTLLLLKQLNGDGSPAALGDLPLDERVAAFTPSPSTVPASDILFDAWALTTIHEPLAGRPMVADYLHGKPEEWQPPETHVAWRREVELITGDLLNVYDPESLLDDYPLKPHELLRDRYDRVFKHLERLASTYAEAPVWLLVNDEVEVTTLGKIANRDKEQIGDTTVLLPPNVGGLTDAGMLGDAEGRYDLDVADEWLNESQQPRRRREIVDAGSSVTLPPRMRLVRAISLDGLKEADSSDADADAPQREWRWYVRPPSADDDGSKTSLTAQDLPPHNSQVGDVAFKIVTALGFDDDVCGAVACAGRRHDDGKNRRLWQMSIGNRDPQRVLAKSGNRRPPEIKIDYRHEFGSLLEVVNDSEFKALSRDSQELVLHLIAAHHGRARPHFSAAEAFDPNFPEDAAAMIARDVPRRFAQLQRKYGRWGLAYLESLLRAADAYASAYPAGGVQ